MTKMTVEFIRGLLIVWMAMALVACSSNEAKLEQSLIQIDDIARRQVDLLARHISNGRVKNALLLERYAANVAKNKPDYRDIADALALDAGVDGPIFTSLNARLDDAKNQISKVAKQGGEAAQLLLQEYESINTAASVNNYNMMLTDPINVLADMSDGKLPRVGAMAKKASISSNGAKDLGHGSQLVGNPNYGQWKQSNNGTSFWAFYGQYAFFSSMLNSRYNYGYWSNSRDYSYYHDVGRRHYSSPAQKTAQVKTEDRTRKHFRSRGKSFQSPYAKAKSSGSSATRSVLKAPSKFNSSGGGGKYSSRYGSSSKSSSGSNNSKSSSKYSSRSSKSSSRSYGGGGK
ncbi:MAG: hypothetical protein COA42_00160 [Alteromonadaceae bacterium]|nr:MAG: hypothetical protein COA42_00160 [Alteromonadaceae bacterium]